MRERLLRLFRMERVQNQVPIFAYPNGSPMLTARNRRQILKGFCMDLNAVSDILRKEAKALFFAKVARDIRKARKEKHPMRKKEAFIRTYQEYLKRYNTYAQKAGIPLGFLLYREVIFANYSWMNALSGYHCGSAKTIKASIAFAENLWGKKIPPIPEQAEMFKAFLKEPSGILLPTMLTS